MQKCLAVNVSLNTGDVCCLSALPLRFSYYLEIYAANKSLVFREVGGLFKTNSSVICNLAFSKSGNYGSVCGSLGSQYSVGGFTSPPPSLASLAFFLSFFPFAPGEETGGFRSC